MSEPKPIDSERLARYRQDVERAQHPDARVRLLPIYGWTDVADLLGDIDRAAALLVDEQQSSRAYAAELGSAMAKLALAESEHLTETAGLISNAAAVREQHSNRVERLLGCIEMLKTEVARLRSRVRVEADDVERIGVTRVQLVAWLGANGWAPSANERGWCSALGNRQLWRCVPRDGRGVDVHCVGSPFAIACSVRTLASHFGRPGLDILDEMAAIEVPS
jgi:hypothetical protein